MFHLTMNDVRLRQSNLARMRITTKSEKKNRSVTVITEITEDVPETPGR